jgi:cell division protein FtsW (lipid II flippase)
MFERRLYYHVDWAMIAAIAALCLIGLMQIYSTTGTAGGSSRTWVTQSYGIGLGLVALLVCLAIDYRSLTDKSLWITAACWRRSPRPLAVRGGCGAGST